MCAHHQCLGATHGTHAIMSLHAIRREYHMLEKAAHQHKTLADIALNLKLKNQLFFLLFLFKSMLNNTKKYAFRF